MRVKPKIAWEQRFPNAAPAALAILEKLLMFDPDDRPTVGGLYSC
jgi:mitogen-activated protein kinase 1/3